MQESVPEVFVLAVIRTGIPTGELDDMDDYPRKPGETRRRLRFREVEQALCNEVENN